MGAGIRYLLADGLKRFIILPVLFNFMLFAGLCYLLYYCLFPYSSYYFEQLPVWLHFLQSVFFIIVVLSFFLLFLSMFTVLFNLVAAPFNGLLAEKAQNLIYNSPIPSLSFTAIALRSIKRQGQFLAYFIPRFAGMLLLFFVPFIQPVYPFLWFLFNAWVLSIQYQDFAMDNNLVPFKGMRNKISENRMMVLGFGTVINLASFIPIINLVTMPAAVIGGVIFYCEENRALKRLPQPIENP